MKFSAMRVVGLSLIVLAISRTATTRPTREVNLYEAQIKKTDNTRYYDGIKTTKRADALLFDFTD